jgi:ABC-type polysaccharide/polyol phosphate transport system ATPase subunit
MVVIQRLSKSYPLYDRPLDRLLGRPHRDFWALRDITLSAPRGEFLAIVGPNGSGKSTLLQVVSGILQPTSGRVKVSGRIAALLELGAGFNPEFSGRDNVMLNGEILGMSRTQMQERFPSIAAFAGVGDYIDRPVREYSSGMYVRLAFSTAIHVDPEVLIVDEALAVGDAIFASRCVHKFEELKRKGVTVLFVSHDLGLVKRLADRAVLMIEGGIAAEGPPARIVNQYIGMVHQWQAREISAPGAAASQATFRHGDGCSRIERVDLLGPDGSPAAAFETGSRMTARVLARFYYPVEDPIVGILIRNRLGIDVFGTNTRVEGKQLGAFQPGDSLEVEFSFHCLLTQQDYTLTAATQHWDGSSQDWLDDVVSFAVSDDRATAGLVSLPTGIAWRRLTPVAAPK